MMTKEKTVNGSVIKRSLQAGRSMSLRVPLFFLHGNRKESSFYSIHLLFSSSTFNFLFFNGSIPTDGFIGLHVNIVPQSILERRKVGIYKRKRRSHPHSISGDLTRLK